jgi:hypothetical protein
MPQKQATSPLNRDIRPHRRPSLVKYALTLSLLSISVSTVNGHQIVGPTGSGQVFVVEAVAIGSDNSTTVRLDQQAQAPAQTRSNIADPISTDISTLTGGIHWPQAGIPGFAYPDQNSPDPLWSSPTIVPLPPAVWAGLIGTAIIGTQLVRRSMRRPTRVRLF